MLHLSPLALVMFKSAGSLRSALQRGLLLLTTILLLVGAIAAQDAVQDSRKTQEEAAVKLMSEGLNLATQGSPASLRQAIEKFESARALWHSLNNTLAEATVLAGAGAAY